MFFLSLLLSKCVVVSGWSFCRFSVWLDRFKFGLIFSNEISRMLKKIHLYCLFVQEAHRGNVLFLLFMLQDSPRLTFAYLHYMEYYTIFLPFLRAVNGKRECGGNAEVGDTTCLTKVSKTTYWYTSRVGFTTNH